MSSHKQDFPIFKENPGLIYLDSAATAQKPSYVIEKTSAFMSGSYASIHRGSYDLSGKAEDVYYASKEKFGKTIGFSWDEIIYTYNATYAYNMLAQTLWYSGVLEAWDTVLVDIAEHHANLVPWQMLSQRHWILVEWIDLNEQFWFDMEDFKKKYFGEYYWSWKTTGKNPNRVKVVSISAASNVTGKLYNLDEIAQYLDQETFFIVDWSQATPHVSLADYKCNERIDALIATGHKMMADSWIGMLALRKKHIKSLQPARWGGGMIEDVTKDWFILSSWWLKFEPGTPHIIGAASLLYALEYLESIGGYDTLQKHEKTLMDYALERIQNNKKIALFWPNTVQTWSGSLYDRIGIFSFRVEGVNATKVWEILNAQNIAIRAGWHCTHPLFQSYGEKWACRISPYIYNDITDLEKTFDMLENM